MDGVAAGDSTESSFEKSSPRPCGRTRTDSKFAERKRGHIDVDGQIRRMHLVKATQLGQPDLPGRYDVLDRTTSLRGALAIA